MELPRRILMTADTAGGVWTYALDLARALPEIDLLIATMGGPAPEHRRREAEALENVQLAEGAWKLEWMEDPWAEVDAAGEWLRGLEREWTPEVVHLNGYAHGAIGWNAPVLIVAHSCVCSWWRAVRGGRAPDDWAQYRMRVEAGLAAADLVVAPTAAFLRQLREEHEFAPPARVIWNGRHEVDFAPGMKEGMIFAAGRFWDEAKNLRALDTAAAETLWPVYVAGDTAPARHANSLGFLSAPDLRAWLARAGIYASPAYYEPFGLSVLEAALSGCALVLGDIPTLHELWSDAAVFVSPGDAKALADVMNELIENAPLRESLAAAARQRAGRYSLDAMGAGYRNAYAELIAERSVLSR
jgi:glycogen(starch) synthase